MSKAEASPAEVERANQRFMRLIPDPPVTGEVPALDDAHHGGTPGAAGTAGALDPADEAARDAGPADHDDSVVEVVAAKILIDWLRNRRQLLVPFKLDLQKLEPQQLETILHALVAAVQADGSAQGQERERLTGAMQLLNANEDQRAALETAIDLPRPLSHVLREVPDVQSGALVYAASLLAVDRRKLVNRQYLRYVAARLQLPRDVVRGLEQRYGAAAS